MTPDVCVARCPLLPWKRGISAEAYRRPALCVGSVVLCCCSCTTAALDSQGNWLKPSQSTSLLSVFGSAECKLAIHPMFYGLRTSAEGAAPAGHLTSQSVLLPIWIFSGHAVLAIVTCVNSSAQIWPPPNKEFRIASAMCASVLICQYSK